MLNTFSGERKSPLIPKNGPSSGTKKLFLSVILVRLSAWVDELLSTPKIITFLAVSLSKLHKPALSHVIP